MSSISSTHQVLQMKCDRKRMELLEAAAHQDRQQSLAQGIYPHLWDEMLVIYDGYIIIIYIYIYLFVYLFNYTYTLYMLLKSIHTCIV